MGFLKSFTSTVQKGLDQTVGELKPGGKAWEPRKGALGKWDPGKGTLGHWMDQIYGGSTKDFFDMVQAKGGDEPDDVAPPDLSAYDVDPNAQQVAQMAQRKKDQGRIASNLAVGQGASLLTGPRPNLPA